MRQVSVKLLVIPDQFSAEINKNFVVFHYEVLTGHVRA